MLLVCLLPACFAVGLGQLDSASWNRVALATTPPPPPARCSRLACCHLSLAPSEFINHARQHSTCAPLVSSFKFLGIIIHVTHSSWSNPHRSVLLKRLCRLAAGSALVFVTFIVPRCAPLAQPYYLGEYGLRRSRTLLYGLRIIISLTCWATAPSRRFLGIPQTSMALTLSVGTCTHH